MDFYRWRNAEPTFKADRGSCSRSNSGLAARSARATLLRPRLSNLSEITIVVLPLNLNFVAITAVAGLYGGSHGNGESKSHKAVKAAAGGKVGKWIGGGAGVARSLRAPTVEARVHATKKGRCQKVRKTTIGTLSNANTISSTDKAGKFSGTGPTRPAHVQAQGAPSCIRTSWT